MSHLFNAIVILRNNRGQFATGFPFSSILELVRSQPATINFADFAAAIVKQVSGAVSSSVTAALEQHDDRRVQIESQQLINRVVALAPPVGSSWERNEARSLTSNAIDNLTRCRMRLERAASSAPPGFPLRDNGRAESSEWVAKGLSSSSLAVSVNGIVEAVPVICYLAKSAADGRLDEWGVVEEELWLATEALRELLETIAARNQSRLLRHSPVLMLHHQRVTWGRGNAADAMDEEIAFWLRTIEMTEEEMREDYDSVHPDCRFETSQFSLARERFNGTAFLYWKLQWLMQWLREQKKSGTDEAVELLPLLVP